MTKEETLDQLHEAYSELCAWGRDEENQGYLDYSLYVKVREALLLAGAAIRGLPDEPKAD